MFVSVSGVCDSVTTTMFAPMSCHAADLDGGLSHSCTANVVVAMHFEELVFSHCQCLLQRVFVSIGR